MSSFRPAIPVVLLFVVLLLLPQARLRGHRAQRTREFYPRPSYRGTAIGCGALVVASALVATTLTQPDALLVGKVFGIALIALSLVPLVGYGGQISLCQMSFAGIGAIVMAHHGQGGDPLALVYAAVVAGVVGALIALPALRLTGIYLALATAAFAVVLDRWIFNLDAFDLGPFKIKLFELGTLAVSRVDVPGIDERSQRAQLVVLAVAFALLTFVVVALRRSRLGDRLLAMKDSPAACATLGLNLTMTKLAVFAASAAMAGVGGALYAGTLGSVSPDTFNLFQSLPVVLLAVVGGIGSAGGAFFAGLVLGGIPIVIATWSWFLEPSLVLPGAMGISLGNNPNGVVRDLADRFDPLRRQLAVLGGLVAALVVLYVLRALDVLPDWPYAVASVVAIFAAPIAAQALPNLARSSVLCADERDKKRGGQAEVQLEYVGVDRPFTEFDVRALDEVLALPAVRGR